ncbi:MAG: hypothetical protein BWY39_00096 [Spirochaetes bacterium ADurb.Bin269]|nr:MAG: hypothetical protein BWY39_00096 [Spirochaetes bacterium ADurb.Bin269]
MSYTRSYSRSVTVSGSKTASYSYPASEHGGNGSVTIHYTETVPINVNITLDTDPFDRSVENAENHVDQLTGAVVAMNSAQCASIHQSGKKISDSIANGFFRLINSELTTQLSENKSQLESRISLILELAKDITSKHTRMAADMNRLKKHYADVFNGLDEDCKKRVLAIDKPSFILSRARSKLINEPYLKYGAFSLHETADTTSFNNLSTIARLRNQVSKVINVMTYSAMKTQQCMKNIEAFSKNVNAGKDCVLFLPVVFTQQKNLSEGDQKFFSSECSILDSAADIVKQNVNGFVTSVHAETWKNFDDFEGKMIEQSFYSIADNELETSSSADKQRVYDQIIAMWKSNPIKTL